MIDPSARVHGTADLEADVDVGPRTSIWHRAQVRTGARIGADCIIGRDAFIDEGVTLGDKVKVQNQALVYHGVTVEDGVFIGPNAILTNDRFPRAITSTGDLARADRLAGQPDRAPPRLLDRGRRGRRRRGRRWAVRHGGRGRDRHEDRARQRARGGQPGAPPRLGLRLRPAPHGLGDRGARPGHPDADTDLLCVACDRHFTYVPDAEEIRDAVPSVSPAARQGVKA